MVLSTAQGNGKPCGLGLPFNFREVALPGDGRGVAISLSVRTQALRYREMHRAIARAFPTLAGGPEASGGSSPSVRASRAIAHPDFPPAVSLETWLTKYADFDDRRNL